MTKYVLVPGFPPLAYDEKSPEYAVLKALPKGRRPELLDEKALKEARSKHPTKAKK